MLPTTFTWTFGFSFSKASIVCWIAATSLSRAPPVPEGDGDVRVRVVVLAALRGAGAGADRERQRERDRCGGHATSGGSGHGSLLVTGRAELPGAVLWTGAVTGRRWMVSKTSSRVAARALCRAPAQHRVLGDAGQLEARSGQRQRADLLGDLVAQPGAAGGEQPAGEDDERRVDHRDDGGDPEREPLRERGQQVVAGAGRGEGLGDRGLRGAGAHPELPGQREHLPAAGQLLEAAALPRRTSRTSGVPGTGRKPTSPGAAGGAAVQPAVDHDGRAEALVRPEQDEVLAAPGRVPR